MKLPSWVFPTSAVFFCAACVALSPSERLRTLAGDAGFIPVAVPDTRLRAYAKGKAGTGAASRVTVYIESDGAPWRFSDQPPADPTPLRPLVLNMAIADAAPVVAYLGRPCQYLDDAALAQCPSLLWMQGRYGEPAVTMMSAAVDLLLLAASAQRVRLVGYSGGGVMAALIAAQRHGCVVPGDRRLAAGYRCLDSGDRCVTANGVAESARTRTASGHHRANPHRGRRRRTGAYPRATTLYHRAAASQTGSVARF